MAFKAKGDYKAQKFLADDAITKDTFVKVGSDDHHVAHADADTDKIRGVAQNSAVATEEVEVAYDGVVEVVASGAITEEEALTSTTAGVAVATSTNGKRIGGYAMTTNGQGSGEKVVIRLDPSIL
jgi:hypothetical protein